MPTLVDGWTRGCLAAIREIRRNVPWAGPVIVVKSEVWPPADPVVRLQTMIIDWWRRFYFWLTHAGQWASPEPGVDWPIEPNMGPPWPETEIEKLRSSARRDAVTIENLRNAVGELLDKLGPDLDQNRRAYFDEMTALSQKEKTP